MSEAKRLDDTNIFDPNSEPITPTDEQTAEAVGYLALVADDELQEVPPPKPLNEHPVIEIVKPVPRTIKKRKTQSTSRGGEIDITRTFLNDIGKIPLLTAEQERELGAAMAQGRDAQDALNSKGVDDLTLEKQSELSRQIRIGQEARTTFIESNYRLVVAWAKKYVKDESLTMLDLVGEGYFGLEKAVDKYDPSRGFKFSTYASWWIRQSMQAANYANRSIVEQPRKRHEEVDQLYRAKEEFRGILGHDPTEEEVLEMLEWSQERIARVQETRELMSDISMNAPMSSRGPNSDGGTVEFGDSIPDNTLKTVDVVAENVLLSDAIQEMLKNLKEIERDVISLRFGLNGDQPKTLELVGAELGTTAHYVRQIEGRVFAKLRHPIYRKQFGHLADFLT